MNAPDKTTLSLAAGDVLTLTASDDVAGTITELVQGIPQTPVVLADGLTKGPYATPRTFAIVLNVGTLTYNSAPDVPVSRAEYAALAARVAVQESLHLSGEGAPVDYTDGDPAATGEGVALPGAIYSDTENGDVYRNSGTQAEPAWTQIADVA